MGYYIQVPEHKGKARQIVDLYGGMELPGPPTHFSKVPPDVALICVVDNGSWEAAGFCYSKEELERLGSPDVMSPQQRPRTWLVMSRSKACELTGHSGR